MSTIKEFLKEKRFSFSPSFDGLLDRFDRNGKTLSAWSIGKTIPTESGAVQFLMFGDFATGEKYEWWSRKALTKEEAQELGKAAEDQKKAYLKAKKERQAEAAVECKKFWEGLNHPEAAEPTEYTLRKGLFELYGARRDQAGVLYVPLLDPKGRVRNLQKIMPDGTKRFWPGGQISGLVFPLGGSFPEASPVSVTICEGYATGASVLEAYRLGAGSGVHPDQDSSPHPDGSPGGNQGSGGLESNPAHDPAGHEEVLEGDPKVLRRDGREAHQAGGAGPGRTRDFDPKLAARELLAALEIGDTEGDADGRPASGGEIRLQEGTDAGAEGDGQDPAAQGSDAPGGNHGAGQGPRDTGGHLVLCAFNSGNLLHAARQARKLYPDSAITLAADHDRWTTKPDGTAWNPGLEAAEKAATEVMGAVRPPVFHDDELSGRPTDYNDLALLEGGLKRAYDCLTGLSPALANDNSNPGLSPVAQGPTGQPSLVTYGKGGKYTLPTAHQVAEVILTQFENSDTPLLKQEKDLFRYGGTHWKHLDLHDTDGLLLLINKLCDNLLTAEQAQSYFKMLKMMTSPVPRGRNIFAGNPFAANFLNGTLHVVKNCVRYNLEFVPGHRQEDYLINVLPYEYRPWQELPVNTEFHEMLDRVFEGDDDIEEKKRAVGQLLGTCLLPMTPHLFMLYGPSGTGKSTIIKLAARLVHPDNCCSVDPTQFKDFNMESMTGKLLNYDTDICITEPLQDHMLKKIEDRTPFRIRRKHIGDVMATLPAAHVFGGNAIPPTLDGASGAHARRWTFLKLSKILTKGEFDLDFAERVYESCPAGILREALIGIEDILASNRHFVQPRSGKIKMEQWQLDPVAAFIEAIQEDEITDGNTPLFLDMNSRFSRTKLYKIFAEYCEETGQVRALRSDRVFYSRLEELGFALAKTDGLRIVRGIGVGIAPDAKA